MEVRKGEGGDTPIKIYTAWERMTTLVDLAMSVCPSARLPDCYCELVCRFLRYSTPTLYRDELVYLKDYLIFLI